MLVAQKPSLTPGHLIRAFLFLILGLLPGCEWAIYGVRPDRHDFLEEAQAPCRQFHPSDASAQLACTEYEDVVQRAQALEKAYLTLERLNRWALFVGTAVALASVGALSGLAAFGQAGSDWAKIIPLAGSFVGGMIGYASNEDKANAYAEARQQVRQAITKAHAAVSPAGQMGRIASKYNDARSELESRLDEIDKTLEEKKRAARPSPEAQVEQLKQDNALLGLIVKYQVKDVQLEGTPPTHVQVVLNKPVDPADQKFMQDHLKVRIGDKELPVEIKDNTITVAVPDELKGNLSMVLMLGSHLFGNMVVSLP